MGSLRAAEEKLQFDFGGAAGLGFALAVASGTDTVEDIRAELTRLVRKSALQCCADFDGLVSGDAVRNEFVHSRRTNLPADLPIAMGHRDGRTPPAIGPLLRP